MTALLLFAAQPERITNLRSAAVGLGPGGISNKGAAALRFTYSHAPSTAVDITLVSAHLAAHEPCVQQRNQDWESLVRRLVFDASTSTGTSASTNTTTPAPPHIQSDTSEATPLLSHAIDSGGGVAPAASGIYSPASHLLVMGDLNYRTATSIPTAHDYAHAFPHTEADLPVFLTRDQLSAERAAGNTLHGLVEAPVTFPPTYKYATTPQSSTTGSSGKAGMWNWARHRWPSWCDRILWLPVGGEVDVVPYNYTSIPAIAFSDHQPVALHASLPSLVVGEREGIRARPPFPVDGEWRVKRQNAVAREQLVGYAIVGMTTPAGVAVAGCVVFGVVMLWWTIFA
ncbi:hypothetical protein TWF696_001020 [Orbilia brochopaga]|uniref:Inositol polyphosphate-related phosphatase domain-containing protein n=1 Tax=Orbilia brochopaga TaxID=3140254 RepID=A0AAV9VD40_9PEZI